MRDFVEYFPSRTLAKEKEILLVFSDQKYLLKNKIIRHPDLKKWFTEIQKNSKFHT